MRDGRRRGVTGWRVEREGREKKSTWKQSQKKREPDTLNGRECGTREKTTVCGKS